MNWQLFGGGGKDNGGDNGWFRQTWRWQPAVYRNLQAAERSASRATAKTRVNSQQYREWTPAQLMQREPRQWHRPAWTPAELLQECERSSVAPQGRKQSHRSECGPTAYAHIGPSRIGPAEAKLDGYAEEAYTDAAEDEDVG